MRFLLGLCAVVFSSYLFAGMLSPAIVAEMSSAKYTADVFGVKLGMSEVDARSRIQSAQPKLKFVEYIDKTTNQSSGWDAMPEYCRFPRGCDESIRVRVAGGRVWFVAREKTYDRTKQLDVPLLQVAHQSLIEKYGVLVKYATYSSDGTLRSAHSFAKNIGDKSYYSSCAGNTVDDIPTSFSPKVDWSFSISTYADFKDKNFLGGMSVMFVDCQYAFDYIKQRNAVAEDAAAKKSARDVEAARNIKPNL